jgi:uncharacterized phage-associated protein
VKGAKVGIRFRFNAEKTVEVLLYIAERCTNVYNVLKVLYFADKEHLAKYGRFICGDSYIAMSHGPVPSGAYDLIKYARGDGWCSPGVPLEKSFTVQGNVIHPIRKANRDWLSESDMECLDAAIQEYGQMPFAQLKKLSHDAAYRKADPNDVISLEDIAQSLPDGELLLAYLADN